MNELGIMTPTIRSSELIGIVGSSTERLISICKSLKGDSYIAGFGSVNYQEDELFNKAGIKIIKSSFEHPKYIQLGEGFLKNLSIIDLLFNVGDNSKVYFNKLVFLTLKTRFSTIPVIFFFVIFCNTVHYYS